MSKVNFEVKKFASGEWDVKIIDRIYDTAIIHWNWFDENQRDLMLLLMKIGAIRRQYGYKMTIKIYAPYLPYSRQDRMFECGQDIPIETLIDCISIEQRRGIYGPGDVYIETMGIHCDDRYACNTLKYTLELNEVKQKNTMIVFPDKNAKNHYEIDYCTEQNIINFEKIRKNNEIYLSLINENVTSRINHFIICDDICSGGRTFIECANKLRELYGNDITIELMVYHAFLDRGLDKLKESGISRIRIINPDSYEYICKLYPDDLNYFKKEELK